jgi:transposase
MLTLPPSVKIYLATAPVDLRKGFDGLMSIVRNQWQCDAFSGHLFVFLSRRRDRVKVLFWDKGGFVLYYKRLERGRFRLPPITPQTTALELESSQLSMLLDGLDWRQVRLPIRWLPPRKETLG